MKGFKRFIKLDDILKNSIWQAFRIAREMGMEYSMIYEHPDYFKVKISFEILEKGDK